MTAAKLQRNNNYPVYSFRRLELERWIEEAIALLDAIDPDPDLEDDDLEVEDEHGGDVQDEPHDDADEGNDEPELGWSNPGGLRVQVPEEMRQLRKDGYYL